MPGSVTSTTTGSGAASSGGGQPVTPPDVGNPPDGSSGGNGSPVTGPGGSTTISGGDTPASYQYDIISLYGGVGTAYLAMNNSSMSCNSSVAVFNRNNAFAALSTSTANYSNCCSYAANQGFLSANTSRVSAALCIASLSSYNYKVNSSSSMYASLCASVFPALFGTHVSSTSTFSGNEFESMTYFWSTTGPVPVHFSSSQNSYCTNSSTTMSTKTTAGLSGPLMNGKQVSFLWSQIYRDTTTGLGLQNASTPDNIFYATPKASYRYVPFQHSVDYSNITGAGLGTITDTTAVSSRGIIQVIAMGRNCYTSVKPPDYLYPPEDKSGVVGSGGLTGAFSVSDLLSALV